MSLFSSLIDRTDEVDQLKVDSVKLLKETGPIYVDSRRVADQMIAASREVFQWDSGNVTK